MKTQCQFHTRFDDSYCVTIQLGIPNMVKKSYQIHLIKDFARGAFIISITSSYLKLLH